MKNFYIIILIFSFLNFSCYQAPDSTSGSVSINLDSTLMKGAPAGFDGELRLAVYEEGVLDSLIDYPVGASPTIAYLEELPNPILANNSIPFIGRSGIISLLNVPSGRSLNLLIEHDGTLNEGGGDYYLSYAGVSGDFEVEGGGNTAVAVTLTPTANGTGVTVSNKGPLTNSAYFRIFADEDYSSFITISGSDITNLSFGTSILYESYGSDQGTYFTYNTAILPGRKYRLIVSANSTISTGYPDVGISGTFELLPGLSKSVNVTYYTYVNNCSYY